MAERHCINTKPLQPVTSGIRQSKPRSSHSWQVECGIEVGHLAGLLSPLHVTQMGIKVTGPAVSNKNLTMLNFFLIKEGPNRPTVCFT